MVEDNGDIRKTELKTDEFDELYKSLTSEKARQAADTLFSATPDELAESYDSGRQMATE